jgi:hypothetical protein
MIGELSWCHHAMPSMTSLGVVGLECPLAQDDARLEHGVEVLDVEDLRAHGSVVAFDVAVLLWFALLNMDKADAALSEPVLQRDRDELPAVVDANNLGLPVFGERLLQLGDHLGGPEVDVDPAAQRLASTRRRC